MNVNFHFVKSGAFVDYSIKIISGSILLGIRKIFPEMLAKWRKIVYNGKVLSLSGRKDPTMKKEKVYKIFSDMPTLHTDRLILRPMRAGDAKDMFDYACREEVTRYLLWSPHPSVNYTRDYLSYIESRYLLGDFYDWSVVCAEDNKMIGTCGFTRIDIPNNAGEIGYVLNPDYHGKGYGTEAAEEVLRFGFRSIGLHRIEARFMEGNVASRHVMEKLGMTFEGYRREAILVKGTYRTVGICAILYDDYIRVQSPF